MQTPNPSSPDVPNPKDDPTLAPESGEPGVAGRSHGQVIDDTHAGDDLAHQRHGLDPDAPESGRHQATPDQ